LFNEINTAETNIINAINNQFANLTFGTQSILDEIGYLQSFNEELIFLVTDSVGMQKEAQIAFNNGDVETAMEKLNEASDLLIQANEQMEETKKPIENEYLLKTSDSVLDKIKYWFKGLFL
jgi:hypothetical protein